MHDPPPFTKQAERRMEHLERSRAAVVEAEAGLERAQQAVVTFDATLATDACDWFPYAQ